MSAPIVIGVDPGLSGAICVLSESGVTTFDMPTVEVKKGKTLKRRLDVANLLFLVRNLTDGTRPYVFIEDVGGLPGQSAAGAFSFGVTVGAIQAVLTACDLPFQAVHPIKWKPALNVRGSKDASRLMASQLWPSCAGQWSRKKDDGRAEAALIAEWGRRHLAATKAEVRPVSHPHKPTYSGC